MARAQVRGSARRGTVLARIGALLASVPHDHVVDEPPEGLDHFIAALERARHAQMEPHLLSEDEVPDDPPPSQAPPPVPGGGEPVTKSDEPEGEKRG